MVYGRERAFSAAISAQPRDSVLLNIRKMIDPRVVLDYDDNDKTSSKIIEFKCKAISTFCKMFIKILHI
jgi:hypothetical protein